MTQKSIRTVIIFLVCLFLLSTACKKKFPRSDFYRIIDNMSGENIISSPLIDLESSFDKIEQEWTGEDMVLIGTGKEKLLAVSTRYPVAAGIKVFKNGKEFTAWQLIKGEKEILPRKLYPKKRVERGIVISEGETLETEIILPESDVIFEIHASSSPSEKDYLHLDVYLNEQKIDTLTIKSYKSYRYVTKVNLGNYRLRLAVNKKGSLYIDRIRVKALKDILAVIPQEGTEPGTKEYYKAAFYCEPVDKVISPGHSSREITFEHPGKKHIEIIAQPGRPDSSLELWQGDKKIGQIKINNMEWGSYFFETAVSEEEKKIRINGDLYIHSVVIENPLKNSLLPVYHLKDEAVLSDLGIGNNPYLVKKKLVVSINAFGYSINTLFAPPKSVFEFPLKLTDSPVLEFGYGLLNRAWTEQGDGVNFKIILETGDETRVIFTEHLNPFHNEDHRRIFKKKIDLSDYREKDVRLRFITEGTPPAGASSDIDQDLRNDLSYWYNPVVFERSDTGTNVILISIDTLRADHLSCYGYERETSPNVDSLAREGTLFLNTFSDSPWTLPSHVSMLTSLNPASHGVNSLENKMPSSLITLSDILRAHNYSCEAFTGGGKVSAKFGFSKGFDSYQESKRVIYIIDSAEKLYRRTARWIDRNTDRNFFLFLHTYQVHGPYNPPSPYDQIFTRGKINNIEKFLKKTLGSARHKFRPPNGQDREQVVSLYDGDIRYTDEYLIKPLIAKLKETGLFDRTMIIFTSDHGEEFYEHDSWEHSHSLYNELIRVPLIIKYPGSKHKGVKIENYSRVIDIVPSVLEELGIGFSDLELDGKSLSKIINGNEKSDRPFMSYLSSTGFQHVPEKISVSSGKYKLILNKPYTGKAVNFFNPPPPPLKSIELYHLGKDPFEKQNLTDRERKVAQSLIKRAEEYLKKIRERKVNEKSVIDEELEERLRALGYIK